jgi:hypothetical protein
MIAKFVTASYAVQCIVKSTMASLFVEILNPTVQYQYRAKSEIQGFWSTTQEELICQNALPRVFISPDMPPERKQTSKL